MKARSNSIYLTGMILILLSGCQIELDTVVVYDDRNDFVGDYEVEEYSESTSTTFYYDIRIRKSRYPDGVIWIRNFYESDFEIFGEVSGNRLYIPNQRIGNLEFEGRGTLFGYDELSLTCTVREIVPGPDYIDFLQVTAWKY